MQQCCRTHVYPPNLKIHYKKAIYSFMSNSKARSNDLLIKTRHKRAGFETGLFCFFEILN